MGSILPSFKKELAVRANELADGGYIKFFDIRNKWKKDPKWKAILLQGWKYANNFSEGDLMKVFEKIDPAYQFTKGNVYSRYGFFDTKSKMFLDRGRNDFVTHTRTMVVFPNVFKVTDDALFHWLHERLMGTMPDDKHHYEDPMEHPNMIRLLKVFEKTSNVATRMKYLETEYLSVSDWNETVVTSGLDDGRWVRVHSTSAQGKRWAIKIFEKNVNPEVLDDIGNYSKDEL